MGGTCSMSDFVKYITGDELNLCLEYNIDRLMKTPSGTSIVNKLKTHDKKYMIIFKSGYRYNLRNINLPEKLSVFLRNKEILTFYAVSKLDNDSILINNSYDLVDEHYNYPLIKSNFCIFTNNIKDVSTFKLLF